MKLKHIGIMAALALALTLVAGCASSGRQFDASHTSEIQDGVQDKQTIVSWFGEPMAKAPISGSQRGCVERWTYTYAHAVGFGMVTESHALVVDFDANDKVCDHAYSKLQ